MPFWRSLSATWSQAVARGRRTPARAATRPPSSIRWRSSCARRQVDVDGAFCSMGGASAASSRDMSTPHRVVQQFAFGQRLHRGREGGRRTNRFWLPRRQQREHAPQLVGEAAGRAGGRPRPAPAVGRALSSSAFCATRSSSRPRRRDDDVGAAAQRHHLRIDRHAAVQHRRPSAARRGNARSASSVSPT